MKKISAKIISAFGRFRSTLRKLWLRSKQYLTWRNLLGLILSAIIIYEVFFVYTHWFFFRENLDYCAIFLLGYSLLFFAINPLGVRQWFFGRRKTPAQILQYLGTFAGALLILGNFTLYTRQLKNAEKAEYNTRLVYLLGELESDNLTKQLIAVDNLFVLADECMLVDDMLVIRTTIFKALEEKVRRNHICTINTKEEFDKWIAENKHQKGKEYRDKCAEAILARLAMVGFPFDSEYAFDLTDCVFSGIMFSEDIIKYVDFSHSSFYECTFFDGSHVSSQAWLLRCFFHDCTFVNIEYTLRFSDCVFSACSFAWSSFAGSIMSDVIFQECSFKEFIFNNCNMDRVDFEYCTASELEFRNVKTEKQDSYNQIFYLEGVNLKSRDI